MVIHARLQALGIIGALAVAGSIPSFAARAIAGAVGNVSQADGALLDGTVGFRIYSAMPGGETNFNDNTSSCRNIRCVRPYSTNPSLQPGGFVGNQEATQVYNGDSADQPFYMLVDGCLNDDAVNHIGFFGVGGVTGNNSGVGSHLSSGCLATTAQNCFSRLDADYAGPGLLQTYYGFGGPHSIRPTGGLNPIPNVRVQIGLGFGCPTNMICLRWDDPPDYAAAMRPSNDAPAPPSPVQGVTIYRFDSLGTCVEPTGAGPWTPVGSFPLGGGAIGTQVPMEVCGGPVRCTFFALRVRVAGPGGLPNTLETSCVGVHSQPIESCGFAVRIARFNAVYAGHGVVSAAWTTGVEGDILGFYLTRGASATGPFVRVSDLVPTRGDASRYSYADRVGGGPGRVYYYQLEILGRDGNVTTSSTVAVTLPGRARKSRPAVR